MRKITKDINRAFEQGRAKTIGNTHTDGNTVWLHGNAIVRRNEGGAIEATLAGWNTLTTRERVNGITGMQFHQVNFEAFLDGKPICETAWIAQS